MVDEAIDSIPVKDFKRILRTLTEDIDKKLQLQSQDSLYNFFTENFTLTGVITEGRPHVNFQKFAQIYESYKMNIYDLLDLMTGNY